MPGDTATSSSRDRMLEAAIDLMRAAGLAGAGINEIVRASGAPKGSVYHFFPGGKAQIAAEALRRYAARVDAFIDDALSRGTDPAAKVESLFAAFARRVEDGRCRSSCAVGAVALDLDDDVLLEGLRPVLAEAMMGWSRTIAARIDLGAPGRSRSFAGLLLTAIEGAYVRARAEGTGRPFVEAGRWLAPLAMTASRAPGGRNASLA
jgi:TetR/AcrR family transcriptional repressor of lmrAB and yxaGH operons